MIALCVNLVAIMSDGEEVFIGVAFVAFILTSPQLVIFGVKSEFVAIDDFVGILDGLLEFRVILAESWVSLRVGDGCHLLLSERLVTPHEVCTRQESLSSLLGWNAWVAVVVF